VNLFILSAAEICPSCGALSKLSSRLLIQRTEPGLQIRIANSLRKKIWCSLRFRFTFFFEKNFAFAIDFWQKFEALTELHCWDYRSRKSRPNSKISRREATLLQISFFRLLNTKCMYKIQRNLSIYVLICRSAEVQSEFHQRCWREKPVKKFAFQKCGSYLIFITKNDFSTSNHQDYCPLADAPRLNRTPSQQ